MKQRTAILVIFACLCQLSAAELSLLDCYEKAEKTHPLQREWQNRQQVYELHRKNLNTKWLPSFAATANATYMSDVVEFDQVLSALPVPIPPGTFPTMPKEQYKLTLDLNQILYDGGAIAAGKKVELAALDADKQTLQTEF